MKTLRILILMLSLLFGVAKADAATFLIKNLIDNITYDLAEIFQATNINLSAWQLYPTGMVSSTAQNIVNPLLTDISNLQGSTNALNARLQTMQVAVNNVLSNIANMISFYWTNSQASSMLLSNLVNNPYVDYTNILTKTSTTVIGTGSGNTNYLITLSTNSINYFYLGSGNVHIYTVAGSTRGSPILWTAVITNLSALSWGFNVSSGTNRWRWWNSDYKTNRPITLTNNTALRLNGQSDGTNILVDYIYFRPGF